ncbi:MAG: hypothetical protein JSS83_01170 [Cyanobacteria bacterium SZAS LIN-3]|nr:hypothetical protein [Cyanobacteria bacterium SZAS LIN-3]MBS2009101.1 hypothetical protein [Cyanobacteria bacterium SZAS TMP-1]
MNDCAHPQGDDPTVLADELSTSTALICELLNARGAIKQREIFSTVRPLATATDVLVDRNGDGKNDARYSVWFDGGDSSIRAVDVDLNNDGKRDWRVGYVYTGGKVPDAITIDTDLDGRPDFYLPVRTTMYGTFDSIDLDGCQKQGFGGRLDMMRTPYGSLSYFDLMTKTPDRKYWKIDVKQTMSSRPCGFNFQP